MPSPPIVVLVALTIAFLVFDVAVHAAAQRFVQQEETVSYLGVISEAEDALFRDRIFPFVFHITGWKFLLEVKRHPPDQSLAKEIVHVFFSSEFRLLATGAGADFREAISDLESNLLHQGLGTKPVAIGPALDKDKRAEGI